MGIDYYNCEVCESIFHDAGHYGYCGNCEANLCGPCFDKMGEKNGVLGEDHEDAVNFGEDAPRCCDKCDGSLIDEGEFVSFLVDKLGKTREELETEFRTIKNGVQTNPRGGTTTVMSTLDVGTKFYVHNGHWRGEIVEIDGVKHLAISGGGSTFDLTKRSGHTLDITIDEEESDD